jgi:hypothetical protein
MRPSRSAAPASGTDRSASPRTDAQGRSRSSRQRGSSTRYPGAVTSTYFTRHVATRWCREATSTPGGYYGPRPGYQRPANKPACRTCAGTTFVISAQTQRLELGLDHFAVSIQLGHEDGGALVMARYGHPSKDAARKRLLRLSARSRQTATERRQRAILAVSRSTAMQVTMIPIDRQLPEERERMIAAQQSIRSTSHR